MGLWGLRNSERGLAIATRYTQAFRRLVSQGALAADEQLVATQHYGLDGQPRQSLKAIAATLGLTYAQTQRRLQKVQIQVYQLDHWGQVGFPDLHGPLPSELVRAARQELGWTRVELVNRANQIPGRYHISPDMVGYLERRPRARRPHHDYRRLLAVLGEARRVDGERGLMAKLSPVILRSDLKQALEAMELVRRYVEGEAGMGVSEDQLSLIERALRDAYDFLWEGA